MVNIEAVLIFILRSRADSNRCARFCRPVPNPSATGPSFNKPDRGIYQVRTTNLHIFSEMKTKMNVLHKKYFYVRFNCFENKLFMFFLEKYFQKVF